MERMEEELMEDLFYQEAEGAAELGEEEEWEGMEAMEEAELGEEEEWEAGEEGFLEEGFEEEGYEGFEEAGEAYGFEESEEAFEDAMAYALEAEDTDEFFRRLWRGVRRVGSVVGRVARVAAPIARLIPHPYAQVAARGLGLLGRLRAEGASEEEALEAFAELAAYDESAIPVLAGLAVRRLMGRTAARLPRPVRRQLVRTMGTAARTLINRRGPRAIRALPRIVASIRRTAAARRTPVRSLPRVVQRTVARVSRSRPLTRRLSRPQPRAIRRVRTAVRRAPGVGLPSRSFTMAGPVRITITSA